MSKIFLSARWENIVMANYEVKADLLQPYLPHGVALDAYQNKIYISLVGFMFKHTRLFHIPIPVLGNFEEINLRFYVKRVEEDMVKRGVVFISETVPFKSVAWLANKLYKEHYISIPTKHTIIETEAVKQIKYQWQINKQWNQLAVKAGGITKCMLPGSIEEFIYEHYYGYTKLNAEQTQEYKVNHPRWSVLKVNEYAVCCDFKSMYGNAFSFLSDREPDSVMVAEGSPVTINWKRSVF